MASSSLDLVRSIYVAWCRGEILPTEATAQLAHPNIEVVVVDGPEPSSRKGMAAATPGIEGFLGSDPDGNGWLLQKIKNGFRATERRGHDHGV